MLAFIIACILIELTPGPNMAYLTILSLSAGRRAGFATVAGITLGLATIASAAAFGMAELIHQEPMIYEFIRWLGVIYMLWLAFSSWREEEEISPARTNQAAYHARYFRRGFIVNVLNPKAAVFYLTVLPGFIHPDTNITSQTWLLIAISVGIATAVHAAIVLFASALRPMVESQGRQRQIRRFFSLLLVAVAIWFAFATR